LFKWRRNINGVILGAYNSVSGLGNGAFGRDKVLGPKVVKELQATVAGERAEVIRHAQVTHQEV
jgi:hypothetical protein